MAGLSAVASTALAGPVLAGPAVVALGLTLLYGATTLRRRLLGYPGLAVGLVILVVGVGVTTWTVAVASGDRSPLQLTIGPGVTYERFAADGDDGQPQVFHVAIVDLNHPCLSLGASKPDVGGEIAAETGSAYVERTGAVLAVNVGFYFPLEEYPPWSAYPRNGDPVNLLGRVVEDNATFGVATGWPTEVALAIDHDGRADIGRFDPDVALSVPGRQRLLDDGRPVAGASGHYPRTAVGVDRATNRLILLVADGKQPRYAEGATYAQVAKILARYGADEAMELDGGGSSTMTGIVGGETTVLSRPSHQRIPGRERPVAVHLGAFLESDCENP